MCISYFPCGLVELTYYSALSESQESPNKTYTFGKRACMFERCWLYVRCILASDRVLFDFLSIWSCSGFLEEETLVKVVLPLLCGVWLWELYCGREL